MGFRAVQSQKIGLSMLKLGKSWELGQTAHLIDNAVSFPLKMTEQVISGGRPVGCLAINFLVCRALLSNCPLGRTSSKISHKVVGQFPPQEAYVGAEAGGPSGGQIQLDSDTCFHFFGVHRLLSYLNLLPTTYFHEPLPWNICHSHNFVPQYKTESCSSDCP